MRVMAFNIFKGGKDEHGYRIESIKEVINDASPDFVALQEANNFDDDSNDLLKEVSQSSGQKWLRKSEQGDKWNRCLIEGMIVLSETGARDEQTTPP